MSTEVIAGVSIGVVVIVFLWMVLSYNRLVRLRNRMRDAWADIDAALKQRYDLVPNLVATVKGYAAHERDTLEAVTQARAAAMSAGPSPAERTAAEQTFERSLRSLMIVGESYPELRASGSYQQLMSQLSAIEDTLHGARRYYNGTVRDYNTARETFPTSLIAAQMGFETGGFFEATAPERQVPQVSF